MVGPRSKVRLTLAGGGAPSDLHQAIALMGAPVLLTTNFDTLLEHALQHAEEFRLTSLLRTLA